MNETKGNRQPVGSLLSRARAKTMSLGIDRIVESLTTALTKAGARNVETSVSDRTAQIAIDEGMSEAFVTFGGAVAAGAAVTILGGLVGTTTGEREERKGCALLSVSMKGEQAQGGLKEGLRALQRAIWRHRGALRARRAAGEIRVDLYLPVLRGS